MELHDKLFDTKTIAELVAIKYFDYKKGAKTNQTDSSVFSIPTELEVFKSVIDLFKRALNIDLKIYIGVLNSILHYREGHWGVAPNKQQTYTFYTNTNVIIKLNIWSTGSGITYNIGCLFADKTHHILRYDINKYVEISSNIDLYLKVDKEHIIEKMIYLPRMINDYLMICTDEYIMEMLKLPNSTTNILAEQLTDESRQLQQNNLNLMHNLTDALHKLEIEIQKHNELKNKYVTLLETKLDTAPKQKTNNVLEKDSDDEYDYNNIYIRIREK
jgi:hypothetical protein